MIIFSNKHIVFRKIIKCLLSQILLVATLAANVCLILPEQSGLLRNEKQPAEEAGGKQPFQESGGGKVILRPDGPLTSLPVNPNQHAGNQLEISGDFNDGVKMANGQEFDRSGQQAVDLSINPWSWEPQRIQPRQRKTHFLTKKFQEKSGRDLLKRQTSVITEHDQASDHGFKNVVVKTADYDKGEKAIVPPSTLPQRNLESDRPASGGLKQEKAKTCIDSDRLLFCISSAKVLCPKN